MPEFETKLMPPVAEPKPRRSTSTGGKAVSYNREKGPGHPDNKKAVDFLNKKSLPNTGKGALTFSVTKEQAAAVKETEGEGKEVAVKYLKPEKTEKIFQGKQKKAGHLAKTTATTKKAETKIAESEKAQDKPEAEQHSDAGSQQVEGFAGVSVAEKSKQASLSAMNAAIEENAPKELGDLRDFKKKGKGKQISSAVMANVSADVGSVKQGFGGMAQKPAPAPAEKGEELPPTEEAGQVEHIGMGKGVVPKLEPEHTATAEYVDKADELLKKEEVQQEDLDEVTSGEVADAKAGMEQLKKDAVEEPKALKAETDAEHKKLNTEMEAEEKQARGSMAKHRSGKLKDTGDKQKDTKTKLEKERETVAKTINDKFEACQKSITQKLDDLEKNSLKRFDDGQAAATTAFEEQVNKDIEAFKKKRYDTDYLTRKYRQVRDWFLGIADFPEVQQAFDNARKTYVSAIDTLVTTITADNNKVIADCKKELADCKTKIAEYVAGLKKSLQGVGQLALKDVTQKLDQLNKDIDKRKEKMQQQLAEKREAAIKAIDEKIAKMKEKLSGALSQLGKWLKNLALKIFKWACNQLGLDAEAILGALRRAGQAFMSIIKNVRKFFGNLIASVKGAINTFRANFKEYLTAALFDWLTGTMGNSIKLPKTFDLKGVLSIILQVAGITWAFIRSKLVVIFGEQKVKFAEEKLDIVKKFLANDIEGIWDWIKDSAQNLMETMISGIKEWTLTKLVIGFAEWIAMLLIPGAGLVKVVQGIYKLVMWFVDNIKRIISWVNSVLDSFASIAGGAIAAAIQFIVAAMRKIIPVILDFFAKLLNISGIVQAVKNIINKIVGPIHKAIDKFVEWLKALLNKVVDKVKGAFGKKEDVKQKEDAKGGKLDDTEVGKVVHFNDGEEEHELWISVKDGSVEVMVASSNPKPVKQRIIEWRQKDKLDELSQEEQKKALDLLAQAEALNKDTLANAGWSKKSLEKAQKEKTEAAIKDAKDKDNKVESDEEKLKGIMLQLFRLFSSYPLDEEGKRLVGVLLNMNGIKGASGFAGTLKGSKIPAFREGLKTQAKRAEHYYGKKLLLQIEKKEEGTRVDLVILSSINENAKDKDGVIYIEVKHWTGWSKLEKTERDARLLKLEQQLLNYKNANTNVLLEWVGAIPKEVQDICDDHKIKTRSI